MHCTVLCCAVLYCTVYVTGRHRSRQHDSTHDYTCSYPTVPLLSGKAFLRCVGELGWDLAWFEGTMPIPFVFPLCKLRADLDLMFPRTSEGGNGPDTPVSDCERESLVSVSRVCVSHPVAFGGGINILLSSDWAFRDFSNSINFCNRSGEILGIVGGTARGRAGVSAKLFGSSLSSKEDKLDWLFAFSLSGYKNSSWVPVRRRACVKQNGCSVNIPVVKSMAYV